MKKSPLRMRIDSDLFGHVKTFKRMGFTKPSAEELRQFSYFRLIENPVYADIVNGKIASRQVTLNKQVMDLVGRAVQGVTETGIYKNLQEAQQ